MYKWIKKSTMYATEVKNEYRCGKISHINATPHREAQHHVFSEEDREQYGQDKQPENEKGDDEEEKESHRSSEDETDEGSSSNADCDQDSDVSFRNDTDEDIDTAEIEQEDWIECIKKKNG